MADDGTNGNMDTSGSQQNDDDRKLYAGGLTQEIMVIIDLEGLDLDRERLNF